MTSCVFLTIALSYSGANSLGGTLNDSILMERLFSHGNNKFMSLRSGNNKKVLVSDIVNAVKKWLAYDPDLPHIFHYAGHGGRRKTRQLKLYTNPTLEVDGRDEGLYDENMNFLSDNDFAELFKDAKCPLAFFMDNCHSDRFVEVCDTKQVLSLAASAEDKPSPEYWVTNIFDQKQIHGALSYYLASTIKDHAVKGEVDLVKAAKANHNSLGVVSISETMTELKVNVNLSMDRSSEIYAEASTTFGSNEPTIACFESQKKVRTGCC